MKIPFNKPPYTGNEDCYVLEAMRSSRMAGDGSFGKRCQGWLENMMKGGLVLLTPSCTHALEMAALLLDISPGDEVIMPSYTFVSTANAFALRGATIVFVDIRADTQNIDEKLIEQAVTKRTKAIVVVHYAGISCEMDFIMQVARKYDIAVVEDAAQAITSFYRGRPLGSYGSLAAFSFHETKNITSGGEGGALVVNDENLRRRAEVIREKGTNRSLFFRGMVDKYTWIDVGSSYLPSEIQAAYLWGQLERIEDIQDKRHRIWNAYASAFRRFEDCGRIQIPFIPNHCQGNAHLFYIICNDLLDRTGLIKHLATADIMAAFHYVPLHNSPAGRKWSRFNGADQVTSMTSERLVRLPIFYSMQESEVDLVIKSVSNWLEKSV